MQTLAFEQLEIEMEIISNLETSSVVGGAQDGDTWVINGDTFIWDSSIGAWVGSLNNVTINGGGSSGYPGGGGGYQSSSGYSGGGGLGGGGGGGGISTGIADSLGLLHTIMTDFNSLLTGLSLSSDALKLAAWRDAAKSLDFANFDLNAFQTKFQVGTVLEGLAKNIGMAAVLMQGVNCITGAFDGSLKNSDVLMLGINLVLVGVEVSNPVSLGALAAYAILDATGAIDGIKGMVDTSLPPIEQTIQRYLINIGMVPTKI